MDIEKLKQKVLDLAIRGKLVSQDPNDEPATVLIEKIKAEKAKLVKEGKIKASKEESYIYKGSDNCYYEKIGNTIKNINEEIPFEIPSNWCWIRLNDIGLFRKGPFGSSLTKDMFVPENVPLRRKVYEQKNAIQKDCSLGKYFINNQKFEEMKSFVVEPGDIIVSCAGTIGEIFILPNHAETGIINQALMRIKLYSKIIEEYFIIYFDIVLKKEANEKGKGTGMKNIPAFDVLKKMLLPLPSEGEIKRIISCLKNISPQISKLESSFTSLDKFVEQSRLKILDSFFGENSSYKSYYGERKNTSLESLIPKGKIGDGDWVLSENMDEKGEYSLVQLKHIGNGKYLSHKSYNHINSSFFVNNNCSEIKENYLLINRLVANEMDVCLLPKLDFKTITSVDVCWIAPNESYNQKYLMYYLLSSTFQNEVMIKASGSTRKRISKKNLIKIPIAVHDINIQQKIVENIEKMFGILDSIIS